MGRKVTSGSFELPLLRTRPNAGRSPSVVAQVTRSIVKPYRPMRSREERRTALQ